MLLAVVVLFATTEVGLDAAEFGLVYGLGNVGFLLGALSVGVLTNRFGIGRTFAWSTYVTAFAMILIALAGGVAGVILLLAGRFIGAAATPLFNVNALSLRQARVSDAIMGRVNATFLFIDWGPLPSARSLAGCSRRAFGPRAALVAAAICGVVGAVWIAMSPAARLTSLFGLAETPDTDATHRPGPTRPTIGRRSIRRWSPRPDARPRRWPPAAALGVIDDVGFRRRRGGGLRDARAARSRARRPRATRRRAGRTGSRSRPADP